jgi:hypothetical protein
MMESTPRLGFPFLAVGQANKELVHNESLQALDAIVAAAVEQPPLNDPPSSPVVGRCYIVGDAPTGPWAGKAQCLAEYTSAGWKLVAPAEGMTAYVSSTGTVAAYRAGAWEGRIRGTELILDGQKVVGGRGSPIASPSGGTVVDAEARSAIGAILSALRTHGLIQS